MHSLEIFREQGIQGLERYLCTLERFYRIPHLSYSTHETLHVFYHEARRIYYILSEWMVLSVAESEAYKARLDCLAGYRIPRPSKVKI